MYIVKERNKDGYVIYDTEDRSSEFIDNDTVRSLLSSNIFIYGVTLTSMDLDIDVRLLLNIFDGNFSQSYDGYIMEETDEEKIQYNCHCIDINSIPDDIILYDILSILRSRNKDVYVNISSNDNIKYTYVGNFNNGIFSCKSIESGVEYSLDCFDCIYLRYVEKCIIIGLDIYKDRIVCESDGIIVYIDDILKDIRFNSASYENYKPEINIEFEDQISLKYGELNGKVVILNDMYIPLFDLSCYVERVEGDYPENLWWRNGEIIEFDKTTGISKFENGVEMPFEDTYWFVAYNMDKSIFENAYTYYEHALMKYKVLNRKAEFESRLYDGLTLKQSMNMIYLPRAYVRTVSDDKTYVVKSDYGNMQIKYNYIDTSLLKLCYAFDSVFLMRMANVGTLVYDLNGNILNCGKTSLGDNSLYSNVDTQDFHNVVNDAIFRGISYLDDAILPLCVGRIHVHQEGVCIYIDCLVPRSVDGFAETGNSIVTIPLHLMKGKFKEYNDCFEFKTVLHTIVLSKELVYNLHSFYYYNESQAVLLNGKSNKNIMKCYDYLQKQNKRVFKRVLSENNMI